MIKIAFKIVRDSVVLFCVVSFLSFLYPFVQNHLNHTWPNLSVGFPFQFYYQFAVRNNCNGLELQHGTNGGYFILNCLICLIIAVIINYRYLTIKKTIK